MLKTFLVTGGYGFIGSNFIRYVLSKDKDCQVINLDNLSIGSSLNNLKGIDRNCEFVRGDISDPDLTKLIERTDVIVNFAAETHVDRSISSPSLFARTNFNGVLNLLENIRKSNNNPLFVQIGTDEEYGSTTSQEFSEDDAINPSSSYSASKAGATLMTLAYNKTYSIKTIVTRSSNNYGMYQFPEKFIPKAIIKTILGMKIPIYGNGENIRDWIFVEDNVKAIHTILDKGQTGKIYNICSGSEISNNSLIDLVAKLMNREVKVENVQDRPGHDIRYAMTCSRLEELGWKPYYTLEGGLKKTVEWYIQNEQWWRPLINANILSSEPWKLKW